jgi:hypothetical protein
VVAPRWSGPFLFCNERPFGSLIAGKEKSSRPLFQRERGLAARPPCILFCCFPFFAPLNPPCITFLFLHPLHPKPPLPEREGGWGLDGRPRPPLPEREGGLGLDDFSCNEMTLRVSHCRKEKAPTIEGLFFSAMR